MGFLAPLFLFLLARAVDVGSERLAERQGSDFRNAGMMEHAVDALYYVCDIVGPPKISRPSRRNLYIWSEHVVVSSSFLFDFISFLEIFKGKEMKVGGVKEKFKLLLRSKKKNKQIKFLSFVVLFKAYIRTVLLAL